MRLESASGQHARRRSETDNQIGRVRGAGAGGVAEDMKRVRVSIDGQVLQEVDADRELVIGRGKDVDVRIADKQVSTRHATVRPVGDGLVVTDLGSTNGTVLDGGAALAPNEATPFGRGQKLTIGPAVVEMIEVGGGPESSFGFGQEKTMVVGGAMGKSLLVEIARFQAARPRLVLAATHSRRVVPLEEMQVTVGRDPASQVRIDHPSVSGKHATISFAEGRFSVEDLGSGNGTKVDGVALSGTGSLDQQAWVQFGTVDALFVRAPAEQGADGGDESRYAPVLANHAAALGKVTKHQAEQALAEHRDSGASVGEVFVREGSMSPADWVALWKRREDILILGASAGASPAAGKRPWLVFAILALAVAIAALLILK